MIEIKPVKKLDAIVAVPGSKYVANRVLIIAALADGVSTISNIPDNNDIKHLLSVLEKLGVRMEKLSGSAIKVFGTAGKLKAPEKELDIGESGTLMRFITGVAALVPGETTITGSQRIRERPIGDLLRSLRELGVECISLNKDFPPVIIRGGTLKGGTTTILGKVSSQFISSLLLAAPYAEGDITVKLTSELVSKAYVDMTLKAMKQFGIEVERKGYELFRVKSGAAFKARNYIIPADWSSASYFLAAAAIVPGKVTVTNLDFDSGQGEAQFAGILEEMGCAVVRGPDFITIKGTNYLKATEKDLGNMPDVAQTLAAVAAFANGKTRMTNIGHLKYKECDRIEDTAEELRKMGVEVDTTISEISVNGPAKFKPAVIEPHNDHRLAMSLSLLGLKIPGIRIRNPEVTRKSFPEFWDKLTEISSIKNFRNIILIGYRGAGKTKVSEKLAEKLNRNLISIDSEIEKKTGPITNFINEQGWEKFRRIETEVLRSLTISTGIIDCGGGIVETEENVRLLKDKGVVVWLKADVKTLVERLKITAERPSLTGKPAADEVRLILSKRTPLYKKLATYEIDTDGKDIETIAEEIISAVGVKPIKDQAFWKKIKLGGD